MTSVTSRRSSGGGAASTSKNSSPDLTAKILRHRRKGKLVIPLVRIREDDRHFKATSPSEVKRSRRTSNEDDEEVEVIIVDDDQEVDLKRSQEVGRKQRNERSANLGLDLGQNCTPSPHRWPSRNGHGILTRPTSQARVSSLASSTVTSSSMTSSSASSSSIQVPKRNLRDREADKPVLATRQRGTRSPEAAEPDKDKENESQLRAALLKQLNLIKKQSEDLVEKDRALRELQKENEQLKRRVKKLELSSQKLTESLEEAKAKAVDIDTAKEGRRGVEMVDQSTVTDISDVAVPLADTTKVRKKVAKVKKVVVNGKTQEKKRRRRKKKAAKEVNDAASETASETPTIHETSEVYYCSAGEDFVAREKEEIAKIKSEAILPEWRVNPLPSLSVRERVSFRSELEENLDDAVFLKRHAKLELDERRRKRWDMQRMREHLNIQRLKARYEQPEHLGKKTATSSKRKCKSKNSKKGKEDEEDEDNLSESLYPDPTNITHVEVNEKLPICAFGLPIPIVPPEEFSIPWLSDEGEDLEAAMEAQSALAQTVPPKTGVAKTTLSLKIKSPEGNGFETPPTKKVKRS